MLEQLKKEYLDRMKLDLKDDFEKYLNSFNDEEKHGLIINMKKLSKSDLSLDEFLKLFNLDILYKDRNLVYATYDKNLLEKDKIYIGKHPLHHAGLYYVQEPSAAKPVVEFGVEEDDAVLDLCASPGGKTIETLCNLGKNGFIISNEIDFTRAKVLISNIERLGFDNAIVSCCNSKTFLTYFTSFFDKIIVDAPCSGEGMMRKSLEARRQWSKELVIKMAHIQKELLDNAYLMLKNGGKILYSTCTFSMEEDEDNVQYLLNKYNDLTLEKSEKIYPHLSIGEGQFYAIFKKDGEEKSRSKIPNNDIISKINILKYGFEKYEKKHNVVVPTHMSTHIDYVSFDNVIELNYEDIIKYIHGDTIPVPENYENGFYKVTYRKLGIGLGKIVKGVLKNHYPKGLRNI